MKTRTRLAFGLALAFILGGWLGVLLVPMFEGKSIFMAALSLNLGGN